MRWDHVQAFLDAHTRLEEHGQPEALVRLFHPEATLDSPFLGHFEGADAVRRYWTSERATFESVRSDVRRIVREGETCVLEWASEGTTRTGERLQWQGV